MDTNIDRTRGEERRLEQILLDAFPCVALLLRPHSREIAASNKAAVDAGAVPGTTCFGTWAQRESPCPWCLAPAAWSTGKPQHLEVEALGVVWDAHWIPVADDLYMHFAFDITERRRAEARLVEQLQELRRWHVVTLGREMRILDLKREVNTLLIEAGQPPRYPSAETAPSLLPSGKLPE